jgi:hypothetical protein
VRTVTKWRKLIGLTTVLFLCSVLLSVTLGAREIFGAGLLGVLIVLSIVATDWIIHKLENSDGGTPPKDDGKGPYWP